MADVAARVGLPLGRSPRLGVRSRSTAAVLTVLLHAAAVYLLAIGLERLPPPPAVVEQPMQVYLFDRPRAAHPAARLASTRPVSQVPQFNWEDVPVAEIPLPEPVAAEPVRAVAAASSEPRQADSVAGDADGLDITHRVEPVYPPQSSRAREQGTTVVAVLIDPRGHPGKVTVLRSSGFARLDEAAVHAIRQWTFVPPKDPAQGQWAQVQVGFRLHMIDQSLRLAGIHMTLLLFDPVVAGEFRAIVPGVAGAPPKPSIEYRLRGLIERLCAMYSTTFLAASHSARSPLQVLADGGALQQVRFMGLASHALDVDDYRHTEEVRWDLYQAVQERGSSHWLVGVGRDGMIKSVQAMADR